VSAENLRRTADKIREAIEVAASQTTTTADVRGVWLNSRYHLVISTPTALALADWLDAEADEIPPHATNYRDGLLSDAPAVRLASACLGGAS
jgi:hypothetical protein